MDQVANHIRSEISLLVSDPPENDVQRMRLSTLLEIAQMMNLGGIAQYYEPSARAGLQ